jgi:hypothetical protein
MARFLLIIIFSLTLVSCSDIFSTRDPEPPDGNSDNYLNESVLELKSNFKNALLSLNPAIYESIFLNSLDSPYQYRFFSEASDIPHPEVFMDWNIENEKKFLNGFKAAGLSFSDIILNNDPINEAADSLSLTISYEMNVNRPEGNYPIKGNFIFDMIRYQNNFWFLRTWTDISPTGNASISSLKAEFGL